MKKSAFLAIIALLSLSACAETQLLAHVAKQVPKQEGMYKVGNPYQIDGTWYHPHETYQFVETGIASWYGSEFHGRSTANGETFDMYQVTAAHRTLQLPSIVRVTNLENGRAIAVRVNDRGPFKKGRVIDLSKRAAELLGFKNQGTAKVKIELMPDESRRVAEAARQGKRDDVVLASVNSPPPTQISPIETEMLIKEGKPLAPVQVAQVQTFPVTPTQIYVQAGAFSVEQNAVNLANRLAHYAPVNVSKAVVNGQNFFRVRLGPIGTVDGADAVLAKVVGPGGVPEARIIVD